MSSTTTEDADEAASSFRSTATRTVSTLRDRRADGSLAVIAGGATFGLAVRTIRRSKGRAALLAAAGLGLVGLGARRRRDERTESDVETGADARRDERGEKRVSDEAHAEAERTLGAGRNADESASVHESEAEPNPRGLSDRDDVETDDAGDVDYVEGTDSGEGRKTHLEDETAHDPRVHPDADEESTRIDLSDAAMADEASEATGPHPEQAYPAQEGTDPEPTAENAPERTGEGAVAPADSDEEGRRTDAESADADDEPADAGDGSGDPSRDADSTDESRESSDDGSGVDAADDRR